MATVNLTASPVQVDDGTSALVLVTNTGSVDVDLSRGGRLRPQQSRTVYPEGQVLTAVSASSLAGQVTTVATVAAQTQAQQVAANTAAIAGLPNTYATILTPATGLTYNADGTVATQTVAGVTTSYTYNADGTVATEARAGVTRTYTYNTDGTLAGVA